MFFLVYSVLEEALLSQFVLAKRPTATTTTKIITATTTITATPQLVASTASIVDAVAVVYYCVGIILSLVCIFCFIFCFLQLLNRGMFGLELKKKNAPVNANAINATAPVNPVADNNLVLNNGSVLDNNSVVDNYSVVDNNLVVDNNTVNLPEDLLPADNLYNDYIAKKLTKAWIISNKNATANAKKLIFSLPDTSSPNLSAPMSARTSLSVDKEVLAADLVTAYIAAKKSTQLQNSLSSETLFY